MLSIGRFADATGLTVKALRHYDEIGLLVPARVDPDNGYRYYDAAQVEDAVTIRRLRALELPLDRSERSSRPTETCSAIGSPRTVTASRRRCATSTAC
jgi:DNA-binding transcriptional MerR regulator